MQSYAGNSHVSAAAARRHRTQRTIGTGMLLTMLTLAAGGAIIGLALLPFGTQDLWIAAAAVAAVAAGVYRLSTHTRLPAVLTPTDQLESPAEPDTLPQSAPLQTPLRVRIHQLPVLEKNKAAA